MLRITLNSLSDLGNLFNSNVHEIEKLQGRACKLISNKAYTSFEYANRELHNVNNWALTRKNMCSS